jgi:hypothetical protein
MPAVRDYLPLNFQLLASPYNWIIILLMVMIAGLGLHLIVNQPANPDEA